MKTLTVLAIFSMSLSAQTIKLDDLRAGFSSSDNESVESRGTVLFSTFSGIVNPAPFTISSQNFTDAGFTSQGADDFTVPGNGWTIDSVEVRGAYHNGAGPADSVNVYILGNSGSLPDTTNLSAGAIYAAENLSYTDVSSGDFLINLPGGLTLLPGTYWLVVQVNMAFGTGGQWGWAESSSSPNSGTPVGLESAWFQNLGFIPPANGGGFTCVAAWGRRISDCDITIPGDRNPPPEFDLAFELGGTVLVPGISVSPTSLTTSEAGVSDSFDVVLDAPPAGGNSVDIPIGMPDASEGSLSTSMLMFTAANWNIPQTVTVTPQDDALADGDVMYTLMNGPASSGDGAYDGLAVASVNVTNQDDESAGITVNPVSGLTVSEDGSVTANFDVNLTVSPGAGETVTLPLSVSPNIASLSTMSLMFTDTTPQTVTVTGIDDDIDNGDLPFSVITGDPTSSVASSPYDLLTAADVADVTATRLDDDMAGVVVNPTSGLVTSEAGGTDSFDVVLNSEPTADVMIPFSTDDPTEGLISGGGAPAPNLTLAFTPGNWDVNQTITVTGQDDPVDADGDVVYHIIGGDPTSVDGVYDALTAANVSDVEVTNTDDDGAAGISVSPLNITTFEDQGQAAAVITVSLDTVPTQDVSIDITSSDTSEGTISTASLVFTPANAGTPQMVTVQGVDDAVIDGDQAYQIIFSAAVSLDPNYSGLDPEDVSAININDDFCGPVTIDCVIGGPMTLTGTPTCVVDLYLTNGSSNPFNWTLLVTGIVIGAGGTVVVSGIICQSNSIYIVTQAGNPQMILGGPFMTVPTLGTWGLLGLISLLALVGVIWSRRRAL